MIKNTLALIVAVIVLAIISSLFIFADKNGNPSPTPDANSAISPNPDSTGSEEMGKLNNSNWETFSSESLNLQISHPPEVKATIGATGALRLLFDNSNDTQDTELTDGILLIINTGTYTQNSFTDFVQAKQNDAKSLPTTDAIGEISQVSVAGIEGYEFTQSSLGTSSEIYLTPKDKRYIHISQIIRDPKGLGFDALSKNILDTLQYLN